MPTPVVDLLKDDSDLTMHTHTEADLGATLDSRYVNTTGDTMTGALTNTLATGNSLVWDTSTLIVDATNHRVGIGTTSPVRKLQVVVNDAVTNPFGSGGYQALSVQNTNTTDNNWVALSFAGQDTGGTYASAAFFAAQITDHTPGSMDADFTIWTNQAGTIGERMRITNNGNVGIGTTSPSTKLEVASLDATLYSAGSAGFQTSILNTDKTNGNAQILSFKSLNTADAVVSFARIAGINTNHDLGGSGELAFITRNGSILGEAMRINSLGKVGIGTTAPAGKLHINGTADDQQLIVEAHSTQTTNIQEWQNSSGTLLSGVDGSGNLGVGTTPQSAYRLYAYKVSDGTTTQGNVYSDLAVNAGTNTSNTSSAMGFTAYKYGTGNHGNLYAINGNIYFNGTGNLSGMFGFYVNSQILGATSAGTITAIYGTYIAQLGRAAGSTTAVTSTYGSYIANLGGSYITNTYGLYVGDQSGSTNNYAILTNAGNIVFNEGGDASTDFRVESDTEANMLFVDANANTDGSVYLGGTTNGIEIKKGGDLTLLGTAKYERHVQIPAMANGLPANQPAEVDFFTAGGLQFASAGAQYAYCQWEIPDDWDGTDVVFEVDWFPDSGAISGTDTIKWDVEYRSIAEGEAINNGTSVTVSVTDSTDYAQYITKHSRFTLTYNNANQPLVNQDHIYFKISRDTSVANDFAGTVTVAAYEVIYQSKGLPSSN